jgi:MOSC domain-containing protein YiiM
MNTATMRTKQVLSVQTAKVRSLLLDGKRVMTAIQKTPMAGDVQVAPLGLVGDEQANLAVHGGLSKAVYAYPSEHYAFWREQRRAAGLGQIDDSLPFGAVGENLSLQGLLERDLWIGDVLQFAHCALRVTEPREPCSKFNAVMGFDTAAKLMLQTGFCGFYLAVQTPGRIAAGDAFELLPGSRQQALLRSGHLSKLTTPSARTR